MAEVNGIGAVSGGAGISPAAAAVNSTQPERIRQTADTTKAAEQSRQQVSEKSDERRERELENVISTSKDGDTVQATNAAIEQLKEDEEDGRIVPKDSLLAAKEVTVAINPAKERLEAQAEEQAEAEEDEEEQRQITSFVGYSDAQLEQLYLKGEISKQDYDEEIGDRKEARESRTQQNDSFQKEEAKNVAQKDENERDAIEIKNIDSENSSDAPDFVMRAQIMQALNTDNAFNIAQN